MARATIPFLVLVAFALFFATYNTVTMIVRHSNKLGHSNLDIVDEVKDHSSSFIDPVVNMPRLVGDTTKMPFNVALTSTDAPYTKWQCCIMYFWYKRFKDQPGSEMGEFTRVLHSGWPNNLMNEIPIVVVDPLPPGSDRGYVVLNRPWAIVQCLQKATIKEEYPDAYPLPDPYTVGGYLLRWVFDRAL